MIEFKNPTLEMNLIYLSELKEIILQTKTYEIVASNLAKEYNTEKYDSKSIELEIFFKQLTNSKYFKEIISLLIQSYCSNNEDKVTNSKIVFNIEGKTFVISSYIELLDFIKNNKEILGILTANFNSDFTYEVIPNWLIDKTPYLKFKKTDGLINLNMTDLINYYIKTVKSNNPDNSIDFTKKFAVKLVELSKNNKTYFQNILNELISYNKLYLKFLIEDSNQSLIPLLQIIKNFEKENNFILFYPILSDLLFFYLDGLVTNNISYNQLRNKGRQH